MLAPAFSERDVTRARAETPGCRHVVHLDNAGASLSPQPVLDAVVGHLEREARVGGYTTAEEAVPALDRTYGALARLLGCAPDEVALVESATRAWNMAFYAVPFRPGDRILTAVAEYASNYIAFLQVARRTGARVEVVPNHATGQLSVEALREMVDERVRLIAVTHVPTNGGLVNPAAAIGRIAREAGALYLLDACQSVGQMPVDVEAIGCDLLPGTGRKFLRGPRGTGFLYVRRAVLDRLEPPFLDLHAATWAAADRYELRGDARRFESWEGFVAGKIGLGVAVDYALGWGLAAIRSRINGLAEALRTRLVAVPGVSLHDQGTDRCGIVSFAVEGRAPVDVQRGLRARRINVTTSTPLGTRLDMEARGLTGLVRASVHYYNTPAELDALCEALAALGR